MIKQYPAKLRLTALQCLSSCALSAIWAAAKERNRETWSLGWNFNLLSVFYCVSYQNPFTSFSEIIICVPYFPHKFTAGGHFHCNLLLAACLGGGEERACIRRCLLPVSTYHHRGFLSNNVSGDTSLGKVRLPKTSCFTCNTDLFNFDRVCFAVFLELSC